jgi:DNA-binding ferritin-like protein
MAESLGSKLRELGKKDKDSDSKKDFSYPEFVGGMFHCRDLIHLAHFKVTGVGSEAAHEALGDLYEGVLNSADEITELLQSYKGIMNITIPEVKWSEPLAYIKEERDEYIKELEMFKDMPDIQNKLQDLIALFSRTIYKLENLK